MTPWYADPLAVLVVAFCAAGLVMVFLLSFVWCWQGLAQDRAAPARWERQQHRLIERDILVARAQPRPVPHTLTYSPHFAPHVVVEHATRPLPALMGPEPDAPVGATVTPVPPFSALLDQGTIAPGSRLLLGYGATGEAQWGNWWSVYSSLITGLSGSGKSTTIRYLVCSLALNRARFVVVDPHLGAGNESLGDSLVGLQDRFLCAPASDPRGITQALALADHHLSERIRGGAAPWPLIICVDELAALLTNSLWRDVADPVARFLEKVAREGRKRGVFVLAGTQNVKGTRTGGTELRDAFASIFAHRARRNQAQMLALDPEEARLVRDLPPGAAYFVPTDGEGRILYIPQTTAADVARVGTLVREVGYNGATERLPIPPTVPTATTGIGSPPIAAVGTPVAPEAARALVLFQEGKSMAEVTLLLTGIKSNQGSKYQAELTRVQALVRQALGEPHT